MLGKAHGILICSSGEALVVDIVVGSLMKVLNRNCAKF
jgi:hypothetical protein